MTSKTVDWCPGQKPRQEKESEAMKRTKKRTIVNESYAIAVDGGKTTRELFESNGIPWTDELEQEEMLINHDDTDTEDDDYE